MGKGYGYSVFRGIAQLFGVKRHEHFWDRFHVNSQIHDVFKSLEEKGQNLEKRLLFSIREQNKKLAKVILDTVESLLNDVFLESFFIFKKRFLSYFYYAVPPEVRGFSRRGIGIMESQHRKITYRMKNRGMYWSQTGANAMCNLILLESSKKLHALFFGNWREEYQKYQYLPTNFTEYRKKSIKEYSINKKGPQGAVYRLVTKFKKRLQ